LGIHRAQTVLQLGENHGIILKMVSIPRTLLLAFTLFCPLMASGVPAETSTRYEGLVTPERVVELAAPSEGLVTRVLVREGDKIEPDAVLAELSSEEEKILMRQAELQSRKLSEDLASMKRLFEEKAVSKDDYTRTLLAAEQAAAERDLAAIRLKQRTITSPDGGYVLRLHKDSGESIRRLETFAEVVVLDRVHVTVYLPAALLGHIGRGSRALIHTGTETDSSLTGEVEVADPTLDAGGEVFRVKVLVSEPGENLKAGMRVAVEFPEHS